MVVTLLLQSGMGAWAVKYPQTPPVMATHFGISLVCFASVFLVMRVLWETTPVSAAASRAVPRSYRRLAWFALLWTIVVAYIGAYMRHSGAELACYTWPLCNGSLLPDLSDAAVAVAWGHRAVAVIALLLVWGLEFWSRHFREERPDLYRTNRWALGLILAQALVGGFVVLSRLTLASTLLHAALMALLFAALADGARRTLVQRRVSADIPTPTALGMHAPAR
jgi:cytochrome c oxidase assembly protein subunit 15